MQQQTYLPAVSAVNQGAGQSMRSQPMDWSGEISAPRSRSALDTGMGGIQSDMSMQSPMGMQGDMGMQSGMRNGMQNGMNMQRPGQNTLDLQNNLPDDVITAPTTTGEVYAGSIKAMLRRNLGNYVVATFLVGTQNMVSREGVLYDVGNDYVTIYQQGRDRYIVNDIYSLKYMEFYDVQRRRLCERLIREQGWDTEENWSPSR